MPEFEGAANFPSEKDDLPKIPFEILGKLLFAAVNPADSFDEFFAPVRNRLSWLNWEDLKFSPKISRDYFVNAHWALYCENYLEGFHIPFVHQGLNEAIDYSSYWGLSVNLVKPLQTDLTCVSYLTFVADESKLGKGAGADLSVVEFEDQAVVESVQKGIRSRFYDKGRYSPTREQGTHHFHRLIAEFMNDL